MIEFQNVTKTFGSVEALRGVSFTVPAGRVTVLIGPSGCGKTTSLRMINRMAEPTDGNVLVDGRKVGSFPPEELRRGIGYVIQSVGLLPHMTVGDNIAIVPRLLRWDKEHRRRRADELLDMVGLVPENYRGKYPHELSGGEAQRIGVARALAADPPIMLMDEPFGAVDPLNREVLQKEFVALQRKLKKTVVFVTHDLDEAIRLADEIILMREGEIVQAGPPERILAAPASEFVRSFVGNDRALKRLACFRVEEHMKPAEQVGQGEVESLGKRMQARAETGHGVDGSDGSGIYWVLDRERRLVGLVDIAVAGNGSATPVAITPVRARDVSVGPLWDLREALSRLLGQGMRAVPVLDEQEHVLGEVRLPDIEALNQTGFVR
ncbi:MAG: betaine/proline/choline family ABC transporter ATP-binding protein [Spirochaetaceae bacterium]